MPDEGTCTLHFTHSLGTLTLLGLLYKSIPVSVLHFSVVPKIMWCTQVPSVSHDAVQAYLKLILCHCLEN